MTSLSAQTVETDEYTRLAQKLYAALCIQNETHLSIEEISKEYENSFQLIQKKNIDESIFYLNR